MNKSNDVSSGVSLTMYEAVAVVRIDNPPLNLLTQDVRRALGDFFSDIAADGTARAVLLAPGEQHFCAGADMSEFPLRFDPEVARRHGENGHRMCLSLVRCALPVVAAIEGACMGGGLELALGCDFRVAAGSARLGLPEIRRGVWPGTGGMPLLARLVGDQRAKALVIGGDILDARDARELGLVDRLAETGNAEDVALVWARELAGKPARPLQAAKRLLDHAFVARLEAHLENELEAYVACYQTEDAREGNRAFFDKREPVWTHG
jgi:enoyl-CoA hydratase